MDRTTLEYLKSSKREIEALDEDTLTLEAVDWKRAGYPDLNQSEASEEDVSAEE